jgi:CheY-like chemotaxis protein
MSGQGQPGGPRTVLYIEDDPPSRLLVRRLLAAAGYAVLEAGDAHSGIARALEVRPALILLDVDLPDLDGYAVAGILRSFPSLAAVPIVAVTAYAVNRGDRERTLVAGCDGYISKPIDPDRFAAQVEEYLGGRREEVAPAERAVYLADLNERFVRRLLAQLESVRALCDQAMRRATCLQRIHEAMDDFTSDLGVPTLLRSLLPRLAEALEVDQLSVELSQPLDSVSARPGRFGPGALSIEEALGRIELKVPLEIGGRMIGFITAFYPASRPRSSRTRRCSGWSPTRWRSPWRTPASGRASGDSASPARRRSAPRTSSSPCWPTSCGPRWRPSRRRPRCWSAGDTIPACGARSAR